MSQIYDFDAFPPPRVTARSLEQARKRRALERHLLVLSIGALLLEVCAMAAVVLAFFVSLPYGLVCAAALCALQTGGGLVLVTFLQKRRFALLYD